MKKRLIAILTVMLLLLSSAAFAEDDGIARLPNKADELAKSLVTSKTTWVSQITGENSPNKTRSRFDVWGTDLGSMTEMNGKVYMFGGDTFSSEDSEGWRSNVLFVIDDDDPSDGLTIVDAVTDIEGHAKELLGSMKRDNVQMTVIPTDIFAIDQTLYCIYMSVKHWNPQGGSWICGFSGLAKSTDEGQNWTKLDLRWDGDSNFIQTAHCLVEDTLYLWGIPAGRFGGVALMKVKADEVEDGEAYEYFTGEDENGDPIWVKGSDGAAQAKVIINEPVGEISVIYNEYLGNFVMTYLHEGKGIVMREGVTPWGEWSREYVLASAGQYASLYGGFMCPKYVEENGKVFYFAMSQFFPIYNIMWMRVELP